MAHTVILPIKNYHVFGIPRNYDENMETMKTAIWAIYFHIISLGEQVRPGVITINCQWKINITDVTTGSKPTKEAMKRIWSIHNCYNMFPFKNTKFE